jgi:hypothetical protein
MIVSEHTSVTSDITEAYQFDGFSVALRSDSIIQVEFKPGFISSLDDAKNQLIVFEKLKSKKKCLLLLICKEDNSFTKETREFMSSDSVSNVIKADALVVKGLALKILMNGYLAINKPKRPTRLFNTESAAVRWLLRFKEKD